MTNGDTSLSTTKRWTLVVVLAATAMLMLDIAVVNTALSRIAADLHASFNGLQWVVDAYTLALASVVLTAGGLADRFGRRRLFTIGLIVFTACSAACAAAGDIAVLDAARAVQGLGAAVMFAVSLAILADAFPGTRERAGALAAYGATIGGAFAIGPLVGGALTSGLGWQWVFLINLPLGLACLWLTRAYVRESRDPAGRPVDWAGQTALIGGLFLLVLALLRGNTDGWGSAGVVSELADAAALLAGFIIIEFYSTRALLPLRFFRIPSFTAAQIAVFGIAASFYAAFFYTTLYFQRVLGLSPIDAGLAYLPTTITVFVVSGATARLGERVPTWAMVSGGLALVAGGMALMTIAQADSSWTAMQPGLLVVGVGAGVFQPIVAAVALGSVPLEHSGLAAGVNDTFRQAGVAVGIAALGALVPASSALGGHAPHQYVTGLHHALIAGAGLAAVAAAAAGVLIRRQSRQRERSARIEPALADTG
jgi:EmrB/QacA subfamily drug resistance transporter